MKRTLVLTIYTALLLTVTASPVWADDYSALSSSDVITIYFGVELDGSELAPPFIMPVSHTDIEVPLLFSGWNIYLNSDAAGVVEPNEGLFALNTAHRYQLTSVPSSLAFLGIGPGQTFWYYHNPPYPGFDSQPMSGETAYLWPWNPNDPTRKADTTEKWLKIKLVDVRGPENGYLSMWQEGSSGNLVVFFSTFDGGITEDDVYYIKAKQHSHNSWAFTQPGLYEVDLQVSTYYVCDGALTGDLNSDCFVDIEDYAALSRYWLRDDCGDPNNCGTSRLTDPNEIDIEDLDEMTEQWLLCGSPFDSECP